MKKAIQIISGLFIISTALWGYHIEYMYELTFISNSVCGLVLLSNGLMDLLLSKKISAWIYQIVLPCTNVVFLTCVFSLFWGQPFNFEGAFFFLHIINPLLFLSIYLFFVDLKIANKADYIRRIFVSPLMIMGYLLFDYIKYIITGNLVYGLISTESVTAISVLLIGVVFYLLMAFMSYGLIELKLSIQKKMNLCS